VQSSPPRAGTSQPTRRSLRLTITPASSMIRALLKLSPPANRPRTSVFPSFSRTLAGLAYSVLSIALTDGRLGQGRLMHRRHVRVHPPQSGFAASLVHSGEPWSRCASTCATHCRNRCGAIGSARPRGLATRCVVTRVRMPGSRPTPAADPLGREVREWHERLGGQRGGATDGNSGSVGSGCATPLRTRGHTGGYDGPGVLTAATVRTPG
jgi:hypothetical protein